MAVEDTQRVDVLVDMSNASLQLAIPPVVKEKNKIALFAGHRASDRRLLPSRECRAVDVGQLRPLQGGGDHSRRTGVPGVQPGLSGIKRVSADSLSVLTAFKSRASCPGRSTASREANTALQTRDACCFVSETGATERRTTDVLRRIRGTRSIRPRPIPPAQGVAIDLVAGLGGNDRIFQFDEAAGRVHQSRFDRHDRTRF